MADVTRKPTKERTLTIRKAEEGSKHPYMLQIQAGIFGAEIYLSDEDIAQLTEEMLLAQENKAPYGLIFTVNYDE